jgi:hypothetical protein
VDLHCLPLTKDPDYVSAVYVLGQGLYNALERRYNNTNAFGADGVVLCDGSDNSAGLVLLLVLQKSTVDCLCLVCNCKVYDNNRCYLIGYKACARGRLSCDILSKAVKPC